MAIATALFGYLLVILLILITNFRILKTIRTAVIQITAGFGAGAIPLVGALPFFIPIIFRLYRSQIKLEKAAYRKWEEGVRAIQVREQNERALYAARLQVAQQAQFMEQEAANEAIPEDARTAA